MSTPLAALLLERIARHGPIPFADYMAEALGHPEYGYYMRRDPFGRSGDFITSPEISQIFGELLGLWLADIWLKLGTPLPVRLAELGPGRGTLMADVLRATAKVPGFAAARSVHFVETSPRLRVLQQQTMQQQNVPDAAWHDHFEDIPEGPLLLIANEFFDALPVHVFERQGNQWMERYVGAKDGGLVPVTGPATAAASLIPESLAAADVCEVSPRSLEAAAAIGERLARYPGAALIVDYGYTGGAGGESVQALQSHRFADPLARPGEADITAHVDFSRLGAALGEAGAKVYPPLEQGLFLERLGIWERTEALAAARPDRAEALRTATFRLIDSTSETAMGALFKVLAAASPHAPVPAAFGEKETP